MTRTHFQDELRALEQAVVEELEAAAGQLARVIDALDRSDRELADEVIQGDAEVDRRYATLQQDLMTLIARQAPVAADLRLVTALTHISRMTERIGDQCVNIAKLVPVGGTAPRGGAELQSCLIDMGRHALDAVRGATRALQEHDTGFADALAERDEDVNQLNRTCFNRAIALGGDEAARTWATAMILVARAFERIGDNAVDIGAHVRFAATGEFAARPAAAAK
jgi:phosphate transport system protein